MAAINVGAILNNRAARQQLGLAADAFGEDAAPLLAPGGGLVIGHANNPLIQQGEAVLHLATMAAEGAAAALPEIEVELRRARRRE